MPKNISWAVSVVLVILITLWIVTLAQADTIRNPDGTYWESYTDSVAIYDSCHRYVKESTFVEWREVEVDSVIVYSNVDTGIAVWQPIPPDTGSITTEWLIEHGYDTIADDIDVSGEIMQDDRHPPDTGRVIEVAKQILCLPCGPCSGGLDCDTIDISQRKGYFFRRPGLSIVNKMISYRLTNCQEVPEVIGDGIYVLLPVHPSKVKYITVCDTTEVE